MSFTDRAQRHTVLLPALAVLAMSAGCSSGPGEETAEAQATQTATTDERQSPSPEASPSPEGSPTPSPSPRASETEDALPEIPPAIRGVYSHPYTFWNDKWSHLVDLVETTELNAVVVDVKDEAGTLLWDIDHPLATEGGGSDWRKDYDGLDERLEALHEADGWAIARIACFKDTEVAKARPDLAVQNGGGGTWIARGGEAWLNPYRVEAGQWCIDVALAALERGFDEIQFDYIRFPNGGDGDTGNIRFPGMPEDRAEDERRHSDEITRFLARASEQIHDAGGYVSADLFGLVTYDFTWDGGNTGQVLERIAEHVDFISLMVYPSHYGTGNYGLKPHPIEHPYDTIWNAMQEAQMRVQGLRAEIRPWLEDFSAPWMGYPDHSPKHVRDQIQATYDNGIDGWLLWNAANTYTESVLDDGETTSKAVDGFVPPARTANPGAAPGGEEREWPGMPPCDPYPGILQVGEGNLVGSTPAEPALAHDDPRLCAGVADGEEAKRPWDERKANAGASAGATESGEG